MNITNVLSHKIADARVAMAALIESRALSIREDEPDFPASLAVLAWQIADAMDAELVRRRTARRSNPPPPMPRGGR